MDALQLAVYIWMFLDGLVRDQYIEVPEIALDLTNFNNSESIKGTLHLTNVSVTGLDTIVSSINNIDVTEDELTNNHVCVYVPIGHLLITTEYSADIGIADEIPIYGDGIFVYSLKDIDLNICTYVNFIENQMEDVKASIIYQHIPLQFTGFWRNDEVSIIVERLLNLANRLFAMWSSYEPERASCVISPFVAYVLNNNMGKENNTLTFDFTCLQGFFRDGNEELDEYLLVETLEHEDTLKTFLEENKYLVMEHIIRPLIHSVKEAVEKSN